MTAVSNYAELLTVLCSIPRPHNAEAWVVAGESPDVQVSPEYRRAVHDVLSALGVLKRGETSSAEAYYFVQSLALAVREGAIPSEAWSSADGAGVKLLNFLESARLHSTNPAPIRTVEAVMAVIKARRNGEDVYLMQYDDGARKYQPLGGKRELDDPSIESALVRELCEELEIADLQLNRDFSLRPLVEHAHTQVVSASLNVITRYDHNFYFVADMRFTLPDDPRNRWITAAELAAGKTSDGRGVSRLLIEELADLLPELPVSIELP
jgi:8-oxo-dGTP pyrophosphatase MutT (NUDIX family)